MKKSQVLDNKIVELQKAVEALKSNRDQLVKELEIVKARAARKRSV